MTAASAAMAALMLAYRNWKTVLGGSLVMLVMGAARCYLVVHYPTDVLAGLLVGALLPAHRQRSCSCRSRSAGTGSADSRGLATPVLRESAGGRPRRSLLPSSRRAHSLHFGLSAA